jgi:predicted transcriptional regulator of viral defense system
MKITDFLKAMDNADAGGIWVFNINTLKLMFREKDAALTKSLAAMEDAGLIKKVCRGLYVNPKARSMPGDTLSALVPMLRPWSFNYLSLESVLSDAGLISQLPSRLTFMTTGREGEFFTPFGVIEFVRTKRKPEDVLCDIIYDEHRGIHVANTDRALKDLRRVGRNLDLVIEA